MGTQQSRLLLCKLAVILSHKVIWQWPFFVKPATHFHLKRVLMSLKWVRGIRSYTSHSASQPKQSQQVLGPLIFQDTTLTFVASSPGIREQLLKDTFWKKSVFSGGGHKSQPGRGFQFHTYSPATLVAESGTGHLLLLQVNDLSFVSIRRSPGRFCFVLFSVCRVALYAHRTCDGFGT